MYTPVSVLYTYLCTLLCLCLTHTYVHSCVCAVHILPRDSAVFQSHVCTLHDETLLRVNLLRLHISNSKELVVPFLESEQCIDTCTDSTRENTKFLKRSECRNLYKYELRNEYLFFWAHGKINRSSGQTNRVSHDAVLGRFVCHSP